jgi:hypothetical protein
MTARLRSEAGSAMVIAITVVMVMMAIGLGTFTLVQGQQRQSADERVKDSAYSLAEAALEDAVTYLGSPSGAGTVWSNLTTKPWGVKSGQATPGLCDQSSQAGDNCPDPSLVAGSFNSASQKDYAGAPTWTTKVVDNSAPAGACTALSLTGSCYYRESVTNAAGANEYDQNGDGAVWVRAQATVRGRTRILVALVKPTTVPLPYSKPVIFTNTIQIAASLNQKVVDTQGSASSAAALQLSCVTSTPQSSAGCPNADPTKGQIAPWTVQANVMQNACIDESGNAFGFNATNKSAVACLSTNQGQDLTMLRARAQAAGTYYSACPTAAQLTGKLVFVDGAASGGCNYTSGTFNSAASPGMVVLGKFAGNGASSCPPCFQIAGTAKYYGLIYDANEQLDSDTFRVSISGTGQVIGAVISDWTGGVYIDSTTSPALIYDPRAYSNLNTTGPPKIIQGTVREVPVGS